MLLVGVTGDGKGRGGTYIDDVRRKPVEFRRKLVKVRHKKRMESCVSARSLVERLSPLSVNVWVF